MGKRRAVVDALEAVWRMSRRATGQMTDTVPATVLVGVMSADDARRERLRRAFAECGCRAVRVVYVVGLGCCKSASNEDLLRVPTPEFVGVVARGAQGTPSGTLSSLRKLVAFLEYAASAAEESIARMDDDA